MNTLALVRISKPTRIIGLVQNEQGLALEPEWEARFEANSYGFRPGRGCHDAIEAIFSGIHYTPKYVLDADIAKCFDRINHDALLTKLNTFPLLRRFIKRWLKAGVMDGQTLFPTEEGTPQGGVISPLLANIALHGLETDIMNSFPQSVRRNGKQIHHWQPRIIRYADDFVILHRDLEVIEEAKQRVSTWLNQMGLELKPSKTQITHTLHEHDGRVGFDFLGFNIRQFPVGKTHWRTSGNSQRTLDFITLTRPSQQAVLKHYRRISDIIAQYNAVPQYTLIKRLNPIIRGWCNYYATGVSKQIFSKLDHLVTKRLLRWAYRRHPHRSRKKTVKQYWQMEHTHRHWIFRDTTYSMQLIQYADTPIKRHTKVSTIRSPFDGDWAYWGKRLGRHPMLPKRVAHLLKMQNGKCPYCNLNFKHDDIWEVDHIMPKSQGGTNRYDNLQLLHKHCHHNKSRH